jgi:hypothetical protein
MVQRQPWQTALQHIASFQFRFWYSDTATSCSGRNISKTGISMLSLSFVGSWPTRDHNVRCLAMPKQASAKSLPRRLAGNAQCPPDLGPTYFARSKDIYNLL